MAAFPSARNVCASNVLRAAKWCCASIPPAIIPSWLRHPIKMKNRCSFLRIAQNDPFLLR
jgi:hypothetical protein